VTAEATPLTDRSPGGRPDAVEELHRLRFADAVRLAHLLSGDASVAEDLAQEAFVRVRERLDRVDAPWAYLRAAVVNACRSHDRSRGREAVRLRLVAGPQGVREVPVAPAPADGRVYGARFALPDPPAGPGREPGGGHVEQRPLDPGSGEAGSSEVAAGTDGSFEMNLYQDGFESRLADRVSSTTGPVEMVEIGGVPAAVGPYGELDWWVMMEPDPGRTLELRISYDRATVDWVIAHARFVDEAAWDEATGG
jgi:hypothetical protein